MVISDEERLHLLNNRNDKPQRKSSKLIHIRSVNEVHQAFIDLVNSGIVSDVEKFLEENPAFYINCEDYRGFSPLNIAIHNQDVDMVIFLLSLKQLEVRDGHLHAVEAANINILVAVLDRLRASDPNLEFGSCDSPSCIFPADMRPLVLAAHKGDVHIIRLLLKRGHHIETPHSPNCLCNESCNLYSIAENVEDCTSRLHVFKALTNPVYICLTARDPILEIFNLYRQIGALSNIEELQNNYIQLQDNLKQFSSDLIGLCQTTSEIEIMLKEIVGHTTFATKPNYPRLILAIENNQKEFVAHSNVQQVLRIAWLGECYAFDKYSIGTKILIILSFTVCIPLAILSYFVAPHTRLGRIWATPLPRFFGFIASYLIFTTAILIHTNVYLIEIPDTSQTTLILIMGIWIFGFILRDLMKFIIRGPKYFIATKWTLYDVCTEVSFLFAFAFWGMAYFDPVQTQRRDTELKNRTPLDPVLMGEGILSIASIFALGRLFCVLQLNSVLGPLQVSVQKMAMEIVKLAGLFLVIIIAFSSALNHLYWYYSDMSKVDEYGSRIYQVSAFTNFRFAMKSLFWTLFGAIPLEAADAVMSNGSSLIEGEQQIIQSHWFTQEVGYFLFGIYHVVALLLFMNMLVAAMTTRMDKVLANAEMEWKYSRSLLWLDFFDDANVLPVPMNLLGIPWLIGKAVRLRRFRSEINTISPNYELLLNKLIQRYLHELEERV